MIHAEVHVSSTDPFSTGETEARGDRYGVSGIPHVRIDGKFSAVGAGSCASAKATYQGHYNTRMTETGGTSPVDITGYYSFFGTSGSFQVNLEQLDAGTFNAHQVSIFLFEDDITWCCGYGGVNHWDGVTRTIKTEAVSLTGIGQTATVIAEFDYDPSWVPANLHAVAIFEEIGGTKTVLQVGELQFAVDFAFSVPARVASVPGLNGAAYLSGTIENVSAASDVLSLSVDTDFGWPTDFLVAGDPTFYTSHSISLAPGETREVTIRVQTDGVKRIGTGHFLIGSANTGRVQPQSLRVWNGSHSILFVDDDNNTANEVPFESALTNLGYLFEDWNVASGHGNVEPRAVDMLGFDAVVWQTAYTTSTLLGPEDIAAVQEYLDFGGSLFLSSMDFLTSQTNPNPFVNDYLGVASWTNNSKASSVTGVGGDPISDSMTLPLTWPQQSANRVDTVNPGAGATATFFSETNNPAAVRFELANNSRTAFTTFAQNVVSTIDPDPNNSETVIERTLIWLLDQPTTGVGDDALAGGFSRMLGVHPNPFTPATELRFVISPSAASEPTKLVVVDAAGRMVRQLADAPIAAGLHSMTWDGLDNEGRAVAAGLYFARQKSADGESSTKLIRVR